MTGAENCGNCGNNSDVNVKEILATKWDDGSTNSPLLMDSQKKISIGEAMFEIFPEDTTKFPNTIDDVKRNEELSFCFACSSTLEILYSFNGFIKLCQLNVPLTTMLQNLTNFLNHTRKIDDKNTQTDQVSNPYVKLRDCLSTLHKPFSQKKIPIDIDGTIDEFRMYPTSREERKKENIDIEGPFPYQIKMEQEKENEISTDDDFNEDGSIYVKGGIIDDDNDGSWGEENYVPESDESQEVHDDDGEDGDPDFVISSDEECQTFDDTDDIKSTVRRRGTNPRFASEIVNNRKKIHNKKSQKDEIYPTEQSSFTPVNTLTKSQEQLKKRRCPLCRKVFKDPAAMKSHYEENHTSSGRLSEQEEKMVSRLRIDNECEQEEDAVIQLRHKKSQQSKKQDLTDEEKLKNRTCSDCGKVFKKPSVMKLHYKATHILLSYSFPCSDANCKKVFRSNEALAKHLQIHELGENGKIYKCLDPGCTKKFRRNTDMKVHYRLHSGEKILLCSLCGINFRHEWSYRRHNILVHGHKPSQDYICESCGKVFKIKTHLNQHLKSKSHGGPGLGKRIRNKSKTPNATETFSSQKQPHIPNVIENMDTCNNKAENQNIPSISETTTPTHNLIFPVPTLVQTLGMVPEPTHVLNHIYAQQLNSLYQNR